MHLTPLEYILIVSTILEFNPLFQTLKGIRTKSVKDVSQRVSLLLSAILSNSSQAYRLLLCTLFIESPPELTVRARLTCLTERS